MTAAEILSLVSKVTFALAVVFLVVTLFFFFKFRIIRIIGDLSGRTAKKSIAKMRAENEKNTAVEAVLPTNKSRNPAGIGKEAQKATHFYADRSVSKGAESGRAGDATEILSYTDGTGTQLLRETERLCAPAAQSAGTKTSDKAFKLVQSIVLIHTTETIE